MHEVFNYIICIMVLITFAISVIILVKIDKNACKCGNTHKVQDWYCMGPGRKGPVDLCCVNMSRKLQNLPPLPLNPDGTCP